MVKHESVNPYAAKKELKRKEGVKSGVVKKDDETKVVQKEGGDEIISEDVEIELELS